MPFTSGQWGPDTLVDSAGNTRLIGATVTATSYVCTVDVYGTLTITGPAADAVVFHVVQADGDEFDVTLPVSPLPSEIDSRIETATEGSLTVQDENSTVVTSVTQLDFQGDNVTVTQGAAGEAIVTVAGATQSQVPLTTIAAAGSTRTLTLSSGGVEAFDLTLNSASCALTLAGAVAGKESTWTLYLRQDATGGRVVTWPGTLVWADGASAPTLSTTPGAVDVITVTSLDGGASFVGVGGQVATSGGGILAVKTFLIGGSDLTTTSSSLVDVDSTNLAVTFTVPASGKVLVRLSAPAKPGSGTSYVWGLREGSTSLGENLVNYGSGGVVISASVPLYITGLTPGATKTYKWAHRISFGSSSCGINAQSTATMEVLAA